MQPAFPSVCDTETKSILNFGMTLRDYFAAKAMQAILTSMYSAPVPETLSEISKQFDLVAPNSYAFADKMLKQREL